MNKTLLITLTTLLSLTTAAVNGASHNKLVYLNQYDINGDGDLLLAEFDQVRKEKFNQTDDNNDNFIDENEYVFEYQNRMDKQIEKDRFNQVKQTAVRFDAVDKNEDDKMTWEEYQASGLRSFTRYDVNEDGVINDRDPKPKKTSAQKDTKDKTVEELAQEKENKILRAKTILRMPSTHNLKGMHTKYDLNKDNAITKEEFNKRRRQDFDRTDEDKNGWLTEEEYTFEYENRLDHKIALTRKSAIKQTLVRFNILDKNENGKMTFEEYQLSGHLSFNRWDTNQNGIVNNADPAPKKRERIKRERNTKDITAKASNY